MANNAGDLADATVRRGRIVVICVIAYVIGFRLLGILTTVGLSGSDYVIFALLVGLAVCLYKGLPWARYVLATLLVIVTVLLLMVFLMALTTAIFRERPLFIACSIVMLIGNITSIAALVAFPSVVRFTEYQRGSQSLEMSSQSPFASQKPAKVSEWLGLLPRWLSLLSSLLFCTMLLSGVVLNATGNENQGFGIQLMAIFVLIAWVPLSVLAILVTPRSNMARIGCLLPFFVYAVTFLVLIYAFGQR